MSDLAAREAIRHELATTLVVEAAAGTGKTTEMVARIVEVIRTGSARLEEIVAVTFTDKAAGELKLRLRVELSRAAAIASEAQQARLEAALGELEVARVGTIHAFCAELLRERPIEAGVDPLFEVVSDDEANRLFDEAFDGWLEHTLASGPHEGMRRLLHRDGAIELARTAARGLLDRRDFAGHWRRDPFARNQQIDDVVARLGELAALAAHGWRDDPLRKLCDRTAGWIDELTRRETAVGARDYDAVEARLVEVARWYEWRYRGTGARYGEQLARSDALAIKDAALATVERLREAADADLAACLHGELLAVVDRYRDTLTRNGKLDFFELLVRTRALLATDHAVRTDCQRRFTRFFVDEFQDTDPLQLDILLLLTADRSDVSDPAAARVVAGKLFVVGDPKQAIYRFRRADVALYEAAKQRLLADGARLVALSTSFRAPPSIQGAINAAFASLMANYVGLAPSRDQPSDRPTVVALPVPAPYGKRDLANRAIEASYPQAVGGLVDWLLTTSGWQLAASDICLVFRRFTTFETDLTRPYVHALEARAIPHTLVGGRSFHDREEVAAIRTALTALEWPDDTLALYATLRGPLFGFHDEDLLAYHQTRCIDYLAAAAAGPTAPDQPIARNLATTANDPPDPADLALEISGALVTLAELHRARNHRPIADTIGRLLAATRAHAGFAMWPAGDQAVANVMRVMDLARRFEARGATSFRSFVDRLRADSERTRSGDSGALDPTHHGVRIMTVHAAKGLEFPVVILCDPTAPLAHRKPTRLVIPERRVWLEPIAGCVPSELRERADEVLARDREEGHRLAYVAATRARDLLVVPTIGDDHGLADNWLAALTPVVYPPPATKRAPSIAPGCPPFGDDSTVTRPRDSGFVKQDGVAPGSHAARVGSHRVVWWDPHALVLDRAIGGGFRQRHILQADADGTRAAASIGAHARWQERRAAALLRGAAPSRDVRAITIAARDVDAGWDPIAIVDTGVERTGRPSGKRFGLLVHAVLADVELTAASDAVRSLAHVHGRALAAPTAEVEAAVTAVVAALDHPVFAAARQAATLRREAPVILHTDRGTLEGIVDLAFGDPTGWTIVDFKTDRELDGERAIYETQVRLYAQAIAHATGAPTRGVLLIV